MHDRHVLRPPPQARRLGPVPPRLGSRDAKPPGFQRAYHARNIRDEDEVISFGLFDMTEDEYRAWRAEADAEENQRVDRLSAFVENEHVAGVYEVVDTVDE